MVGLEIMTATDNYFEIIDADDGSIHSSVVTRGRHFWSTINVDRAVLLDPTHSMELSQSIRKEMLRHHECLREPWINLDPLASEIVDRMRNHVKSETGERDYQTVPAGVVFRFYHFCYDRDLLHNYLQQSFDEDRSVTRPASKPAVMRLLKRLCLDDSKNKDNDDGDDDNDDDDEEKCMVCLEELITKEDQDEVLSMPCSHRFHGHCIIEWLDISPFCPICRFKMPTDEDDVNN